MAICEAPFERESELEAWVYGNLSSFLGPCILLRKFQISTSAGKGAIPDGIAFSFSAKQWYVIECELLRHGVWPHIAEQVSRFVVALQNPETLRHIRDELFEHILSGGLAQIAATELMTTPERLLQQIELFIDGIQPSVVIFIDDANQDLEDFARALAVPTSVYRVKKFNVNDGCEYYSPDVKVPVLRVEPEERGNAHNQDYSIIEALGGGILVPDSAKDKCRAYRLTDGRTIQIRRSKFHPKDEYYWYGINPNAFVLAEDYGTSHLVFVMGAAGFTLAPIEKVKEFCSRTNATKHPDDSVRHYHVLISQEPQPVMYWSNDVPRFDLSEDWVPFD